MTRARSLSRATPLALFLFTLACAGPIGCSNQPAQPAPAAAPAAAPPPADPQHEGLTMPHGDHSPHHGGMVLMRDDLHYEVVFDRGGHHHVWFTDAVRSELPASVADEVSMIITRPDAPPETLKLSIDDAGESWVANGKPVSGDNVMVKVMYRLDGTPYEVELPFFIPVATQ